MRTRIGYWLLLGTAVSFVVAGLAVKMFTLVPPGDRAARVSLFRYYALELPRWFDPPVLGPGASSGGNLVIVMLQHSGLSFAGGLIVAGLAWVALKVIHR